MRHRHIHSSIWTFEFIERLVDSGKILFVSELVDFGSEALLLFVVDVGILIVDFAFRFIEIANLVELFECKVVLQLARIGLP